MRRIEDSPQLYARLGGGLYIALIALGVFAEAVRYKLIVSGDAATTAAHLAAHALLWRFGVIAEFGTIVAVTVLAAVYFFLLNPVNKEINLIATFLRLVGT